MANPTIARCYSTGSVSDRTDSGFICHVAGGSVTDCYWDAEASGQLTSPDGGTGKTTAEMKDVTTFAGWDFVTIWGLIGSCNSGYPCLQDVNLGCTLVTVPTVTTQAATGATSSVATLNGLLTADGGEACGVCFQYGTAPGALLFSTPWQPGFVAGDPFGATIALPAAVTYFRAVARNSGGTAYGAILAVSALGAEVMTLPATAITENTATLNGNIQHDGGGRCETRFQWGAASSYGMVTDWIGGFATGDSFLAALPSLSGGVLYHFRAQARVGGTTYSGRDMQFVTLTPAHMMTLLPMELVQKLGS